MQVHNVAIIGAGPSGIAAAVQLQRFALDVLLLERGTVGGLLLNANWVENYPGFPRGISGPALVQCFTEHLIAVGIEVVKAEVSTFTYQQGAFHLSTSVGDLYARVLVIASGTKPKLFKGFTIPMNLQTRVFYEVHPLADVSHKRIAIVGAGDAAFDFALNLARRNQVLILNHGENPACLPSLWERASQSAHITFHCRTHLVDILEHPAGSFLLECTNPAGRVQFQTDFLIGALGRDPQKDFLSADILAITGELEACGLLYWIGDVKNGIDRQTAIAAGDGIRAAMKIYRCLRENSL